MEQSNQFHRPRRRSVFQRNRIAQGYWLSVLLLCVIVVTLLLQLFIPDKTYSEQENRMLAQTPEFSAASLTKGAYFSGWEDYYADQFPGRNFWISLQLRFQKLMGQKEVNGVYLGQDDYLIQLPTEPDWKNVDKTLLAMQNFAARHKNLHTAVSIIPNAVSILSHKLPANAPGRDQQADLDYLASHLEGLRFIDVTRMLERHKDEAIYYKTDHHWTSLGASYAFSAMAKGMNITSLVQNYDIYTVSDTFQGTLASKVGSSGVTDTVEIYVPQTSVEYRVTYEDTGRTTCSLYDRDSLYAKDHYTVFFGGNHPRITVETTADNGRSLLLFKDSYANCFVQFLTPYYDKIIILDPRYYYGDVDAVISREGITDVLFLYNADTFLSDTSLQTLLIAREEETPAPSEGD